MDREEAQCSEGTHPSTCLNRVNYYGSEEKVRQKAPGRTQIARCRRGSDPDMRAPQPLLSITLNGNLLEDLGAPEWESVTMEIKASGKEYLHRKVWQEKRYLRLANFYLL